MKQTLRERLTALVDVKSIVTILLMTAMVVLLVIEAITGRMIDGKLFLLFSNSTTMIITYFFTKKPDTQEPEDRDGDSK